MTNEEGQGKLLRRDLKNIKKQYVKGVGQKKFSIPALLYLLGIPVIFMMWQFYTTSATPKGMVTPTYVISVEDMVKATMMKYTEVAEMEKSTIKTAVPVTETVTPTIEPTHKNMIDQQKYLPDNDPLATGLDTNEVMHVLQNLPQPGRFRVDSLNEAVVSSKDFKISFYFPPYGGINCFGRYLCSYTASGKRSMEGVGYYLACPSEYPFGTKFIIFNKEWVCEDRGESITSEWLDLEYPYMPYGLFWSQLVTVKIIGVLNAYPTITTTPLPVYPTITTTPELPVYPTITKTPDYTNTPTQTKTQEPSKTNTPTCTVTQTSTPISNPTSTETVVIQ